MIDGTRYYDENLRELRSQLVRRVTLAVLVVALLILWLSIIQVPFPGTFFLLLSGVILICGGGRWLQKHRPALGRHMFIWGLLIALLLAMALFEAPWLPFLGLALVPMAAILVPGSGFASAALICLLTVRLVQQGQRSYLLTALIPALLSGSVLMWLVARTLHTALEWAWNAQARADELLKIARTRQAEATRAAKSLQTTSDLLRRTQRELISARRRAEESRLMKEQFAANISHELRTPLNIILGFSEMMYRSPELYGQIDWPAPLRRAVHQIYRSSQHLLDMIDDVLTLSHFEIAGFTLSRELTPLTPILEDTLRIANDLFQDTSVSLQTKIPSDLPALNIDPTRIRQVILNLLSNARRFTDTGIVLLEAVQQQREIHISVQDTGPGIAPDHIDRLFEEFYQVDRSLQRRHGGAGLGLAICKHFVEAHGGRIWVESTVGQGSTFTFSLPLPERGAFFARLQQTEPPSLDDRESDPPCLLLVDPDPGLVSFVGRQFPDHRVVQLWPPDELDAAIRLHHPHAVLHNRRRWAGASEAEPAPLQTDLPVPIIVCYLPSQSWLEEQLSVAGCLTKPFRSNRLLHLIEPLEDVHNILIIDDERGFCHLVEQMLALSERTYRVRRAYNGRQGLEAMDEERPDLVLLDLVMPSVDGFTVLEEMQGREDLRDVPVLLLTATSYLQDASRQQRGGIAVDRAGGLNAAETLKCIDALLGAVVPFYDESSTPATIAHTRDGA